MPEANTPTQYLHKAGLGIVLGAVWLLLAIAVGNAAAWTGPNVVIAGLVGIATCGAILKHPVIGMYLLIFFLPFERIGSVDIAGVTIRISHVIAGFTILAWIIRGLAISKFKLRPNPLFVPLLAFITVNVVALTNSPNIGRAIFVLVFTLFTIVVALAVPNILRHKHQVKIAMRVLLASMIVVSAFGLYQFLGDLVGLPTSLTGLRPQYTKDILGFPRVQSTALEPLYFANYLLIPIGVAISLFLSKATSVKPWILLGTLTLGGLNLVLTVSRGGYIAFAAMLAILAVFYFRQVLQPRNVIAGLAIAAVVAFVAFRFFNAGEQLESYSYHVVNIFDGASYVERVETFSIAFDIWNQYPVIGIGPGGFGPYAAYHPLITPNEGYRIVNNEYIELLAETGIVGLSLYLLILTIVLLRSYKAYKVAEDDFLKAVLVGLTAALVGILIQYNTFSVLYIVHIWFTIGALIAVQNLLLPKES